MGSITVGRDKLEPSDARDFAVLLGLLRGKEESSSKRMKAAQRLAGGARFLKKKFNFWIIGNDVRIHSFLAERSSKMSSSSLYYEVDPDRTFAGCGGPEPEPPGAVHPCVWITAVLASNPPNPKRNC